MKIRKCKFTKLKYKKSEIILAFLMKFLIFYLIDKKKVSLKTEIFYLKARHRIKSEFLAADCCKECRMQKDIYPRNKTVSVSRIKYSNYVQRSHNLN